MQEQFWTDELFNEFFHKNGGGVLTYQMVEQFKASKIKRDWEIVAFMYLGQVHRIVDWEKLRYREPHFSDEICSQICLTWAMNPANNCTIYSVRRLSDGEVFSVGDRINGGIIQRIDTTEKSMDGIMFRTANVSKPISCAEKLPQPILTTADGVERIIGDRIYPVDVNWGYVVTTVTEYNKDGWLGHTIFSTREAAEKYILDHAEKLSLNDVKEAWAKDRAFVGTEWLLAQLTALVKQKLKQ